MPATITNPEAILDELKAPVEKHYGEILKHTKSMLLSAKECGKALINLKAEIKYQNTDWKWWCETNLPFAYTTAAEYMRLAKNWNKLQPEWEAEPEMSIHKALDLLKKRKKKHVDPGPSWLEANGGRTHHQRVVYVDGYIKRKNSKTELAKMFSDASPR